MPALLTRMSSRPYVVVDALGRGPDRRPRRSRRAADRVGVRPAGPQRRPRPPGRAPRRGQPSRTVMPRAPSSRAVSRPMPLLAPVMRAIVVMPRSWLRGRLPGDERPGEAGTGGTTLAPRRRRGQAGRHDTLRRSRAGRVPAHPPGPSAPGRRRAAVGRPPPARPACAGRRWPSSPACRSTTTSGSSRAAARARPGSCCRAGPRAHAHHRRARVPVPAHRGEPAARGRAGARGAVGDPDPAAHAARHAGVRDGRQVRRAGLERRWPRCSSATSARCRRASAT